ncbi:Dynamin-type guanine nucleotide-binding (G) domain [Arabidopsis thaliana x Arabidopsis arenosa]|uniref:Dynamin-type guanine nucleotide-binding (G) domain n=1 Tax=Arabidopsis thaliana x Arabidopsis arenosa TaxID=1240361 RepID=A0A8T2C697_9BRAS|nr:Dynamin-type guanine nucleotide-binding (G) domain [Arabidopsis thaliana x Arabidopsis arenosa]
MVKSLASPPYRILLFLQQTSVEWCSSLWLDALREIDSSFRRTIVVVSKFDYRLKDFSDRREVDRYLSASGYLGENTRPYFAALPKDRSTVSNDEFRRQISQVDTEVIRHLRVGVRGGFDEEKSRSYIGFGSLRDFLESELQKRYKEAAPATLALLEERCSEVTDDMLRMDMKIPATSDVAHLRKAAMLYTASISNHVGALIDGAANQAPEQWGKTTEEERGESGIGSCSVVQPTQSECPPVSREKVANFLLAHAERGACDRLAFVLGSLFEIALERNLNQNSEYEKKNRKYGWICGFPCRCSEFLQPFCEESWKTVRDEPMKDQENILPENNNGQETTPGKGGESHITVPETPSLEQPCEIVYGLLHNILLRIREVLVERSVTSTLNSGFLTPCRDRLVVALGLDLFAVIDDKFMDIFVAPGAIDVLQNVKRFFNLA